MENIRERKNLANQLRKNSKYEDALPIYKSLWEETKDAYDGTGYLCCLRKLRRFEEALPLAKELLEKYPNFEWCRKEVVWTRIQGQIQTFDEDTPLSTVIAAANSVLELSPDFLAKKLTVFKVLKFAKKYDDWDCIASWIDSIDPLSLSDKPIKIEDGKDGWSDQEIWYNYKIKSYLERNDAESALTLCESLEGKYSKNAKFFSRLKALAYKHLKKYDESISIYHSLCMNRKADWWLLHEYGKVLADANKEKESLHQFCKAALAGHKPSLMVKLYQDIGNLYFDLHQKENALYHYQLVKLVRAENNWPIPPTLLSTLQTLEQELCSVIIPQNLNSCIKTCREIWIKQTRDFDTIASQREIKKDVIGKISIITSRSICFINSKDGLSAICFTNELPSVISNGDMVVFDAEPSFDKKKNRDSWRAVNIRKL